MTEVVKNIAKDMAENITTKKVDIEFPNLISVFFSLKELDQHV